MLTTTKITEQDDKKLTSLIKFMTVAASTLSNN